MEQLPRSARAFLIAVVLTGIACLLCGTLLPWPHSSTAWYEPALFVVLALFANSQKIEVTPRSGDKEASAMSLGFALTFAAMLHLGLSWALVVAVAGCLASCWKQKLYQIV